MTLSRLPLCALFCGFLVICNAVADPAITTVNNQQITISKQSDGRIKHSIKDQALDGYFHIRMAGNDKEYSKQHFKDGYLHGLSEIFINGQLRRVIDYCNGVFCGQYRKFHASGELTLSATYNEAGRRTGVYRQYQQSGRLILERHYTNGLINGVESSYYKNGEQGLENTTVYVDGIRNGEKKHFKRYNKYPSVEHYKNGLLHGKSITYHSNGQIMTQVEYADGIQQGQTEYYDDKGQLIKKY